MLSIVQQCECDGDIGAAAGGRMCRRLAAACFIQLFFPPFLMSLCPLLGLLELCGGGCIGALYGNQRGYTCSSHNYSHTVTTTMSLILKRIVTYMWLIVLPLLFYLYFMIHVQYIQYILTTLYNIHIPLMRVVGVVQLTVLMGVYHNDMCV